MIFLYILTKDLRQYRISARNLEKPLSCLNLWGLRSPGWDTRDSITPLLVFLQQCCIVPKFSWLGANNFGKVQQLYWLSCKKCCNVPIFLAKLARVLDCPNLWGLRSEASQVPKGFLLDSTAFLLSGVCVLGHYITFGSSFAECCTVAKLS